MQEVAAGHDMDLIRLAAGKGPFQPRRRLTRVDGKPRRCAPAQVLLRDDGAAYSLVSFVQADNASSDHMVRRRQDPAAVPGLQEMRVPSGTSW